MCAGVYGNDCYLRDMLHKFLNLSLSLSLSYYSSKRNFMIKKREHDKEEEEQTSTTKKNLFYFCNSISIMEAKEKSYWDNPPKAGV